MACLTDGKLGTSKKCRWRARRDAFEFRVAPPGEAGTAWRYEFRPSGAGTTVTEAFDWYWTPVPAAGFRGRVGRMPIGDAIVAVQVRKQHLQDQVDRTLAALKVVLEGESSA